MIEFSVLYALGCLIALPIGGHLINEFDKSEKPTYDSLDEEIKISIHRMTMFMIITSSWIVVIGFLLFKAIKHIVINKKTSAIFIKRYVISPVIILLGVLGLFTCVIGTSDIYKWNLLTQLSYYLTLIILFRQNDNEYKK